MCLCEPFIFRYTYYVVFVAQIAHAGLRIFERVGKPTSDISAIEYRACQEGLALILPYMTRQVCYFIVSKYLYLAYHCRVKEVNVVYLFQVVHCGKDDFIRLLQNPQCLHTVFESDAFRTQVLLRSIFKCSLD